MAGQAPSTIVYEFIKEVISSASQNSILENAEVLDSAYQEITEDKGIVISNSEFDFAPKSVGVGLYDVLLIIGFYCRVSGLDTTDRSEAINKCFQMAEALSDKIFNDMSLGNRVCDSLILRATDGMKNTASDSFAIINLPIILNPTGQRVDYILGEAK